MKRWQLLAAVVLVVALAAAGVGYWAFHRGDDRFGDPQVLEQIKKTTDCDQLQKTADEALAAQSETRDGDEFNRSVGYYNAATDRMDQLSC